MWNGKSELRLDVFGEEKLVGRCKGGEKDAYGILVKRYARDVFAVCLGVLGNVADAEDCAQEAFVRGFVEIGKLRDESGFRPWILRIARNLCIDLVRRRKVGRDALQKQIKVREESGEDYSVLEAAISRLDEKYREVLIMYYFDGQSTDYLAQKLQIAPATVLSRLSRARRMLRDILRRQGDSNG